MTDTRLIEKKIELLEKALPRLKASLYRCDLCAHSCGVNRLDGEKGSCRAPARTVVYSYDAHHGEEPPLSASRGSGTIFFSHCCMECVYCQNAPFSQTDAGKSVSPDELAGIMLELQNRGCHNINLVSPTHFMPAIAEALKEAYRLGLRIPLVYNTGGYDSPHVIRALDGIVDIYLPDMRYSDDLMAQKYSNAPGYVANNRAIVKEMLRQTGDLTFEDDVAVRGLIIRLLVLPNGISGTEATMRFIASELGKDVWLSVMSQYYPAYKASSSSGLSRRLSAPEFSSVLTAMESLGLRNGWIQPFGGDFDRKFAGETFRPSI